MRPTRFNPERPASRHPKPRADRPCGSVYDWSAPGRFGFSPNALDFRAARTGSARTSLGVRRSASSARPSAYELVLDDGLDRYELVSLGVSWSAPCLPCRRRAAQDLSALLHWRDSKRFIGLRYSADSTLPRERERHIHCSADGTLAVARY
jgi:hypothetical protein